MTEVIEGQLPQSYAADLLLKSATTIRLPASGREFTIKDACVGKAAKTAAALYSVMDETGLRDVIMGIEGLKENILVGDAPNFVSQVVHMVEAVLKKSPKILYRLIGSILLSNDKYAELEDSDTDLDAYIYNLGRSVGASDDGTIDTIRLIASVGMKHLGTTGLGDYLPKAVKAFLGA